MYEEVGFMQTVSIQNDEHKTWESVYSSLQLSSYYDFIVVWWQEKNNLSESS